jgi:TRAP-type C4-dicarboxylate transport system permease small subunit
MTTESHPRDDRSLRELVDQLSADARRLVRAEIDVVRAELAKKMRRVAAGAALVGFAAVCVLLALGAATATAILALDTVMAAWLAALIVTAALLVVAAIAILAGLRILRRGMPPAPTESVESIKEDVSWVKARARSGAT